MRPAYSHLHGVHIPLNIDAYSQVTLIGDPPLFGSIGIFGASGDATASFQLPPNGPVQLAGSEQRHLTEVDVLSRLELDRHVRLRVRLGGRQVRAGVSGRKVRSWM